MMSFPQTPFRPRLTRSIVTSLRAVAGDGGSVADDDAVPLDALRAEVDPLDRDQLPVAAEQVGQAVGVARDEVGGVRDEDDVAPVRRHRHTTTAGAVRLPAVRS